jgi:hypothetical protein
MGELLLRGFLRPVPVFNVLRLQSSRAAAAEASSR